MSQEESHAEKYTAARLEYLVDRCHNDIKRAHEKKQTMEQFADYLIFSIVRELWYFRNSQEIREFIEECMLSAIRISREGDRERKQKNEQEVGKE